MTIIQMSPPCKCPIPVRKRGLEIGSDTQLMPRDSKHNERGRQKQRLRRYRKRSKHRYRSRPRLRRRLAINDSDRQVARRRYEGRQSGRCLDCERTSSNRMAKPINRRGREQHTRKSKKEPLRSETVMTAKLGTRKKMTQLTSMI